MLLLIFLSFNEENNYEQGLPFEAKWTEKAICVINLSNHTGIAIPLTKIHEIESENVINDGSQAFDTGRQSRYWYFKQPQQPRYLFFNERQQYEMCHLE